MAVDRGGLQYTIGVRDEFSATTQRFRQELASSRRSFREFQRDLAQQRGSAAALKDTAAAARSLARANREGVAANRGAAAASNEANRLAARRARTLRNLADNTKFAADAQVRAAREALAAARADERAASAAGKASAAKRAQAKAQREAAQAALAEARAQRAAQVNLSANVARQRQIEQERVALLRAQRAERRQRDQEQATRERQQQRNLQANLRRQEQIEQQRVRQRRANQAEQRERNRRDPDFQAQERINRALFEEEVQRRRIQNLRQRSRTQFREGNILGGAETARQARQLEQSLANSARSGNSLLFTFRRLVGTLAVFTLARELASGFADLLRAGVGFNDTIAASEIGIAGLIATLSDVRNEFGESVSNAEELDLAIGLARRQIRALRQDSLRTTATFEELLDTFQVAVGPGLAAGLNLDEIRELTVQISQAATALGVPQNQLAEEIRSLLSGTIQARTTRIATALGITNADIRRLQETGELFDFLEERLEGFAEAAQRAARQTLSGITNLIRGALGELLGQAAQPLFDELLGTANDLFDRVLTVRDAAGNIRPNPDTVAAFRSLFEALRQGVVAAREFAAELGFSGLQTLLSTLGTALVVTIEFAVGAAKALGVTFGLIIAPVRAIANLLGISNQQLGFMASALGQLLVAAFAANRVFGLFGISLREAVVLIRAGGQRLRAWVTTTAAANANILRTAGATAAFLAGVVLVGKGIEFILERVFGVQLGLRDTVQLVALGLFQAFLEVGRVVNEVGVRLGTSVANGIDRAITAARNGASQVNSLFGSDARQQRVAQEQLDRELALARRISERRKRAALELNDIEVRGAAQVEGIQSTIADIIARRAGEQARGAGFDPQFDPNSDEFRVDVDTDGVTAFTGVVSTADKSINALAEDLLKLEDALRKSNAEFAAGANVGGTEGRIQGLFTTADIESGERLRGVLREIEQTRENITRTIEEGGISEERVAALRAARGIEDLEERANAIEQLALNAPEGQLNSLLRDEADLREGLNAAQQQSFDLALSKAAVQAQQILPELRQENQLLQAQAAADAAVTRARAARLPQAQQALIAAQTSLDVLREEARLEAEVGRARLAQLRSDIAAAPEGEERDALIELLVNLEDKLRINEAITAEKIKQAELDQQEADLVANGDFGDGLARGFEDFGNQFASRFNAGIQIAKNALQTFTTFAAQEIVNAFDPTANGGAETEERVARFFQALARQILTTLIQNAIAVGIQNLIGKSQEAAVEVTAATTAAGIRTTAAATSAAIEIQAATAAAAIRASSGGFHAGGIVGMHDGGIASLRAGGRPRGISGFDTVPAFLQKGEAVIRKSVVDQVGAGVFARINNGNLGLAASVASGGSAAPIGMREGGLVSDQISNVQQNADFDRTSGDSGTILPVMVAGEREVDQLTAGGANAMLAFMRDNAGTISSLLDRGQSRRG